MPSQSSSDVDALKLEVFMGGRAVREDNLKDKKKKKKADFDYKR